MSELPLPEVTELTDPYWSALKDGRLVFQACDCGNNWLPPRPECPACLHADRWRWQASSGRGKVVSFVVYHTAYHPAFVDKLPYNVAIVELEEGPRLIANIDAPNGALRGDMPVRLTPHAVDGFALAGFAPS